LRIGVPKNYYFDQCHEEVNAAVRSAIDLLKGLGCSTTEFEFPYLPEIMAAYTTLDSCEASTYHEREIEQRADDFQPDVRLLLENGLFIPATYYIQAQRTRAMVFSEIMKLFKQFDVMITPSEPMVATKVDQQTVKFGDVDESIDSALSRYLAPFNLTGLPAFNPVWIFKRRTTNRYADRWKSLRRNDRVKSRPRIRAVDGLAPQRTTNSLTHIR